MISDALLRLYVNLTNSRVGDRDGAEVVQVVMIMGIVALIVIAIFLGTGNGGLQKSLTDLGGRVQSLLDGIK